MLTRTSIEKLSQIFRLSRNEHGQDWEVECADPGRIAEFWGQFAAPDMSRDDRCALMALVLASVDLYLQADGEPPVEWPAVAGELAGHSALYGDLVACWRCDGVRDLESMFDLTPYVRVLGGRVSADEVKLMEAIRDRLRHEKLTPHGLREVVEQLRGVDEDAVIELLLEHGKDRTRDALDIAVRVLTTRRAFDVLLMHGLRTGDASSVRWWLEYCVPRVGYRGMLRSLRKVSVESPLQASHAWYWVRGLWRDQPEVRRALARGDAE